MMNKMMKLRNKKGFTLMEMLIVVAIIAVLVAIAIPTFSGALTKSKEAADVANVRALYAEWQIKILNDNEEIPADEAAFLAAANYTFNYNSGSSDKLTYAKDTSTNVATITYSSTKLTGGNADDGKTYTWTLNPLDIK